MDFAAIPAPAEQQHGGKTGEEQGCVLPAVAGLEGGRQPLLAADPVCRLLPLSSPKCLCL